MTTAAQPSYDGENPIIGFPRSGKSSAAAVIASQLAATGEAIVFTSGLGPRPERLSLTQFSAGGLSAPIGQGLGPGGPAAQPAAPAQPDEQPGEQAPDEAAPSAGSWWVITRGEYDDRANLAIFCGTEGQVDTLVAQLNQTRRYVDPYDAEQAVVWRGDAYAAEQIDPITAATDLVPAEGAGR